MIKKIKNADTVNHIWCGMDMVSGTYYDIPEHEQQEWINDEVLLNDIDNGIAVVNNGTIDYADAQKGKAYLQLSSPRMILIPLFGSTMPYVSVTETTYTCKASLCWAGYNKIGIPSLIKMVASIYNGLLNGTGFIRIRDVTNNTTIANKLNIESLDDSPFSLGDIDNLTAGDATWEIQAKITGTAILKLKSLMILW
jgi:hypothetical protein